MCRDYERRRAMGDYYAGFSETKIRIVSPPRHRAPNLEPQADINPTDPAPIFRMTEKGDGMEMITARWWFVPETYSGTFKDFPKKLTTFNARSESAATSRTFKQAFQQRRCLIPADGWYEWTGDSYPKTKWRFSRKDGDWFCIAGLWSHFTASDIGPTDTFTMLTKDADGTLANYHNRRPIALARDGWERWMLDGDLGDVVSPQDIRADYVGGPQPAADLL